MNSLRILAAGISFAALLTSSSLAAAPTGNSAVAARPVSAGKPQLGDFGFDVTGMDLAVAPGEDFYRYANGSWDAHTEIPADQSSWGGFQILRDLSDTRTREVLEQATTDPKATSQARKAAALYASFMNEAAIEARGIAPLQPELAKIAAIRTPSDIAGAFGHAASDAVSAPIRVGIGIDAKDPDAYTVSISQGGLGLPDRDYYLAKHNPKYAQAREAYQEHIAKMLSLAGIADAAPKAAAILELETRIATAHWTRVESRQAEKRYNPVVAAELPTRFPGVDWPALLAAASLDGQSRMIVGQPSAIAGIAELVQSAPVSIWQAYLTYHLLSARADVLPKAFVEEDFAFRKVLSGTPQLRDRWKRGVDFVNAGMGEAVGQLYVARYFPPESKAKADELVHNLLVAMRSRLEHVSWMRPETRAKALEKLASFRPKIGYPNKWRDYSALTVGNDAYANLLEIARFDYDYDVSKLGHPADRSEWHMYPQTVNAYANPVWNEIVFPAAILQPPFFDAKADPAVNYGGIGAVIGHEISHHFDDQGRKYDKTGRLADWWTDEDVKRFKSYTDRVVAQYGAYQPLAGRPVNGELTLGENMADLAGLNVAHDAWLISLHGKPAPVIDGFSGEQRFFLGFAQVWRSKMRDAAMLRLLATDPHTPGNWRPYVVRNMDAWYSAFDVKPGSTYYLAPDQRIKVW